MKFNFIFFFSRYKCSLLSAFLSFMDDISSWLKNSMQSRCPFIENCWFYFYEEKKVTKKKFKAFNTSKHINVFCIFFSLMHFYGQNLNFRKFEPILNIPNISFMLPFIQHLNFLTLEQNCWKPNLGIGSPRTIKMVNFIAAFECSQIQLSNMIMSCMNNVSIYFQCWIHGENFHQVRISNVQFEIVASILTSWFTNDIDRKWQTSMIILYFIRCGAWKYVWTRWLRWMFEYWWAWWYWIRSTILVIWYSKRLFLANVFSVWIQQFIWKCIIEWFQCGPHSSNWTRDAKSRIHKQRTENIA